MFVLETQRLLLRDFRAEDAQKLAAYHSDPRYLAHYSHPPDAMAIVRQAIEWANESPRRNYQLAIQLRAAGTLIGSVGLRISQPDIGGAEFGCELNPLHWERGFAREASLALLSYGASNLGIRRVEAHTAAGNRRAHRLAESLGFCRADSATPDRIAFMREFAP